MPKNGFPISTTKTESTFLIYTPKNIYLIKKNFFNGSFQEKFSGFSMEGEFRLPVELLRVTCL